MFLAPKLPVPRETPVRLLYWRANALGREFAMDATYLSSLDPLPTEQLVHLPSQVRSDRPMIVSLTLNISQHQLRALLPFRVITPPDFVPQTFTAPHMPRSRLADANVLGNVDLSFVHALHGVAAAAAGPNREIGWHQRPLRIDVIRIS